MHPQLTDKKIVCKDFIQALEACHAKGWTRFTGACNEAKTELNQCLHAETIKRAALNREKARESRKRVEKGWADFNADD
ncbi:hypothetical protein HWV62_1561 [Athelia sp. TMB]|nr:hypothetical protein HWV62_43688 [Athelia sp. TMB]KAF7978128.1 hypothetical protein HWV62_1561 [Athelia sp. TMB]